MKRTPLNKIFWLIILIFISNKTLSQNTLPDFTVTNAGNDKVIISWANPYPNLVQVSVQRSYDSLRNFQTIFSTQSPELPDNGYSDNNVITLARYYYRIFYVFDDGTYFFTKSKPNNADGNSFQNAIMNASRIINDADTAASKLNPEFFYIYDRDKDSLLFLIAAPNFNRFKDSIIVRTKDTLYFLNNREVLLKQYNLFSWGYSAYLFTTGKGNLKISLPSIKNHKYRIKIFDENGAELFDMKNITDPELYLEKGNFFHAGWFRFELYEDDKVKERNKFYLPKDY